MTPPPAPQRATGAGRIDDLISEYGQPGQPTAIVPLTQVELAERWQITTGSVQDLLRRQQRQGRVLSRSPLTISTATATAPPLRLVTSPPPATADHDPDHQRAPAPPVADHRYLVAQTLDLIINAAAAGQLDLAHQLKAVATQHLHLDPTQQQPAAAPAPAENAGRAAQNAGPPAENAGCAPVSLEKEQEKNFSSGSKGQNAGLGPAENAGPPAGLPQPVHDVVHKRLIGRRKQQSADATLPWLRHTWNAQLAWTSTEVEDIQRFWNSTNIAEQLSADALAALQLWEPTTAARAITQLAARTDTRNYSARIMDASIWGYHGFYPLQPPKPGQNTPAVHTATSLHQISNQLANFEPDALAEHLESCASQPRQLKTRAALAYHHNLITKHQLANLHFIDSATDIVDYAHELAPLIGGEPT